MTCAGWLSMSNATAYLKRASHLEPSMKVESKCVHNVRHARQTRQRTKRAPAKRVPCSAIGSCVSGRDLTRLFSGHFVLDFQVLVRGWYDGATSIRARAQHSVACRVRLRRWKSCRVPTAASRIRRRCACFCRGWAGLLLMRGEGGKHRQLFQSCRYDQMCILDGVF